MGMSALPPKTGHVERGKRCPLSANNRRRCFDAAVADIDAAEDALRADPHVMTDNRASCRAIRARQVLDAERQVDEEKSRHRIY